ncbi:unnamed protein product [Acanthoscelides obtectus]|uniref:Uncharacterized protein n=1 Tax=Acanthoscelides obtectus TaxID=200917 RepID=A0A9P0KAU2_ACAOB|nr:unnamed protein product [Acanthoscelides obtectus]CAK1632305.1 hypothetical protein AOBTE_LOCUS7471 [Acanthoscelides obtectus]
MQLLRYPKAVMIHIDPHMRWSKNRVKSGILYRSLICTTSIFPEL